MQRRSHRAHSRVTASLAVLVALLTTAFAWPSGATAAFATSAAPAAPTSAAAPATPAAPAADTLSATEARQAARVARYWTSARMRNARPLDLVVGATGKPRLRIGGPAAEPVAGASFLNVPTPNVPPYSFNGRIFIRRGDLAGHCSGTAIDSPTRQLVLTAGHCINSGRVDGEKSVWSDYLQFVPAYDGGVAPFGSFVARRAKIRTPPQWTNHGNPDFDLGAFLTLPNSEGVNVADAVGGGARIVTNLSRHQNFQTFGYPGKSKRMQKCSSTYIGDDLLSNSFPGPPTLGIGCHWAPGASGGGWLIGDGSEINGVNAYLQLDNKSRTFGPYFSRETVGKLVKGF